MGSIQKFINENGYKSDWFVEFVSDINNQKRIEDILDKKEYLAGLHAINKRPNEMFNGKEFIPRRIVLQYARRLLEFGTAYLIGNKVTLTGNENVLKTVKSIYKNGYDKIDFDLVHNVNKFGNAYEYVFVKDGKITSKLIDVADSYPVIDADNEYIAFVESYTVNNITYYNVYYQDRVEKYTDAGGELRNRGVYSNLSGLPVIYRNDNPIDNVFGRSDLDDYISILDAMEDLISRSTDAFYKFISGIPVVTGQRLTDANLPTEIIGGGLILDSDATFDFKHNNFDHKAFETLYKHLMTSLLDVSNTPAVSMGKVDISNLSEVSIKLLFSLANIRAMMSEKFIKEGMMQRLGKFRQLLELQGVTFTDDEWDTLDIVFQYAMPQSEKDVIDNLKALRDMGAMSIESILSHSPYTNDVNSEMEKIKNEDGKDNIDSNTVNNN
jgi:SPP1 family phage portal protein